jgi:hypothetical protein
VLVKFKWLLNCREKKMNICVVSTFDGTTEDYMELWNSLEEQS